MSCTQALSTHHLPTLSASEMGAVRTRIVFPLECYATLAHVGRQQMRLVRVGEAKRF